ncbi:C40 family peptidase [Lachnobacterium bovis]|uniref:C40 family peptidase n=1 Tax=Lachnobacterium bovis TaxID=140626 RepID=UPI0006918D94|nr:SH3 domain-containing C40 family peptidase [Lachnobacterium bovis]
MFKKTTRVATCIIAASVTLGCLNLTSVNAATTSKTTSTTNVTQENLPIAGFSLAVSSTLDGKDNKGNETPRESVKKSAVVQTSDKVIVYTTNNEKSQEVGRLYNNNLVEVISNKKGWAKISSRNLTGYVKNDCLKKDKSLLESAAKRTAKVKTETLKLRENSSTDSRIVSLLGIDEVYSVTDESVTGWVKINTPAGEGFVSNEFVDVTREYTYGETLQEEKDRLQREAEEAAARKKAEEEAAAAEYARTHGNQAALSFAQQYVGNRYVWGGTSLTNGIDCSGYVMQVFAKYGVSLPHSSAAIRGYGKAVKTSEMQPGDVVCYQGHVGIYAGNGRLLSALNSRKGITYCSVNYKPIITVRRML